MNIKFTPLIDSLKLQKIDDTTYFSRQYSNYISNSRLSLINPDQDGSPERFFEGFKPTYASYFDLGTAIHCMTLQGNLFDICMSVDKPTAKSGALADKLYPIYKEGRFPTVEEIQREAGIIDYYKGNLTEGQLSTFIAKSKPYWEDRLEFESTYTGNKEILYLDNRSRETALNCIRALAENKKIQELLHPKGIMGDDLISENEQAILLDIRVDTDSTPPFILKLKAKLDNYTIDKETNTLTVNDIKSIGRFVSELPVNIEKFHYNREFAVYSYLLNLCASKYYNMNNPTIKGNYLGVSTIPKYYTKVVPLTKSMFLEGMQDFQKCMRLVAESVATKYHDFAVWI